MDDQRDVDIVEGGKLAEEADDAVLQIESIAGAGIAGAHHKLQVIDDYVADVVHVGRVGHRLLHIQSMLSIFITRARIYMHL